MISLTISSLCLTTTPLILRHIMPKKPTPSLLYIILDHSCHPSCVDESQYSARFSIGVGGGLPIIDSWLGDSVIVRHQRVTSNLTARLVVVVGCRASVAYRTGRRASLRRRSDVVGCVASSRIERAKGWSTKLPRFRNGSR